MLLSQFLRDFLPTLVFRYIFKQCRTVTKDMAKLLLRSFIYYLEINNIHSLTVFKISGQISFKIAVRLH